MAFMVERHIGAAPHAIVVVGDTVAATNRIDVSWAIAIFPRHAEPFQIIAALVVCAQIADLSLGALNPVRTPTKDRGGGT